MITSLYSAVLGLMLIGLSIIVIKGRAANSIGIGDMDNLDMKRRVRAQANFTEYAPLFLILLGCYEHSGFSRWGIHAVALVFLLGRILNAASILYIEQYREGRLTERPKWRMFSMLCTFGSIGFLAVALLLHSLCSYLR